ncbi:MAG TPA: GSCFA domain-containing protein [Chitinophagales bacterium]|nr:GSCFA domain-containing protein [Chitinophagales bacterium]
MEFRTKIKIPKSSFSISHQDKILLLGSCFTENIGEYLLNYGFKVIINPFGIVYNPVSIFSGLDALIKKKNYTVDNLSKRNELYFSFDHHGSFSDTNKDKILTTINDHIERASAHFIDSKFIIITLGTSYVYKHIAQNKLVANCHKIPNTEFEKHLLTIEEIIEAFDLIKDKLKDKIILFTVSPVRHWRDGAVENQRSKSILIESIHQLTEQNQNCFYFPAYEIMMDELRDYRFYEEDMIHPNAVAVKYIWEQFATTYFNDTTAEINKEISKGRLMYGHRTKHSDTAEEQDFTKQKLQFSEAFKTKFPDIEIDF